LNITCKHNIIFIQTRFYFKERCINIFKNRNCRYATLINVHRIRVLRIAHSRGSLPTRKYVKLLFEEISCEQVVFREEKSVKMSNALFYRNLKPKLCTQRNANQQGSHDRYNIYYSTDLITIYKYVCNIVILYCTVDLLHMYNAM